MHESSIPERHADAEDARLDELLAARARAASDGRLVIDVIIGAALVGAALVWRPFAWVVMGSVGCCLLAFGAWGISDREIRERTRERRVPSGGSDGSSGVTANALAGRTAAPRDQDSPAGARRRLRVLAVCRAVAVVVGGASGLLLILALCAMALGSWVS